MSATLSYPVRALKRENVLCSGRIEIGSDANPDSVSGVIASCSNPSSGVYSIVMNKVFPYATTPVCTLKMATVIAATPVVKTFVSTTGALALLIAAADLTTAATVNQAITLDIEFWGFNQSN